LKPSIEEAANENLKKYIADAYYGLPCEQGMQVLMGPACPAPVPGKTLPSLQLLQLRTPPSSLSKGLP